MAQSLIFNNLGFERDDRYLFRHLAFRANEGDLVQVVGPNGSGKTSLLRVVVGLLRAEEGTIELGEEDANPLSLPHSLLYLGHETGVNYALTALENLRWYFGLNGSKAHSLGEAEEPEMTDEVLIHALNAVGLLGYADVVCHEMSAGQRRRVALARLFVSAAPIWILDEPFTAIDIAGVARLEQQLQAHCSRGGIVFFTTHQASSLQNIRSLDLADFKPAEGSLYGAEVDDA